MAEKMKVSLYIQRLELAASVPNFYNNTPGKNLGYHWADGRFSWDCWNLPKTILAGWDGTNPIGTNIAPTVTGDIDGATMLAKCTEKSKDFTKLRIPGTYLYIANSPHAGTYVGDRVVNGRTVNVIECTAAWGGGVIYTYVDEKGCRYQYKGGPKNKYSWTDFGLLPWVDYSEVINYEPAPTPKPIDNTVVYETYTVKKGDTLSAIAKRYNTTVEAILVCNPSIKDPNKIYIGQQIKIPVSTQQVSTSADKDEKVYHTVQRGETLSGIAKKYGTNYIKLATLNKIVNPNKIYVGQKIRIR